MLFKGGLSKGAQLYLSPIELLLGRLASEDRKPVWEEALSATYEELKVTPDDFVQRLNDLKHVARVSKVLCDQVDLSVRAHLFVQTESRKQDRRIDAYLADSGEIANFASPPDRAEIGSAIRDATDLLRLDNEFSDQQLDGDQQPLFHQHITAFLFARQQNRSLEHEVSAIPYSGRLQPAALQGSLF